MEGSFQKTLKAPCQFQGKGLHLGRLVNMSFLPAEENYGIRFKIEENGQKIEIPASSDYIHAKKLRTAIGNKGTVIETVEHVLAAAYGLGITNLIIEMDEIEPAAFDGSAVDLCQLFLDTGLEEQSAEKEFYVVKDSFAVQVDDDNHITALPYSKGLKISYFLSGEGLPNQYVEYEHSEENFLKHIAPARTFCREFEVEALKEMPEVGDGADESNTLLVALDTLHQKQRFDNELAYHKVLDLIGDMSLLGKGIKGHLVCHRSGHSCNHQLLRKFQSEQQQEGLLSIHKIKEILPHAYPFLLVDRILDFEENKRVVGLKNVTINEPFFQGHFPNEPIMPGVLLIESLAQTGAVFLYRNNDSSNKLVLFTGADRVKFRRQVIPGDQVILEVIAKHMKSNVGVVKAIATVDGAVACEADMKFMTVDK